METLILIAIAVLLYLDLQEQRVARTHTDLTLQQIRLAEQRIRRMTDQSVLDMLEEVRRERMLTDWGEGSLG
jgi:hypothetical protein